MDIYNWVIVAGAAMCVFMAVCVALDSKTWNNDERGGLFEFRHKVLTVLNFPMIFIVPLFAVFYALLIPLGESNMFMQLFFRALIGFGLLTGGFYIFFVVTAITLGFKAWLKHLKKSAK
ncbi:MAG: hypothetical protein IKR92_03710 [Alphaproteobacteria bacterium]|nr:hypothetical protein [Alphaproteobacteria bacterium]